MNADEYTNLERVERDHWYYAGKRELVSAWLERCGPLRQDHTLIDCGAGTGIFASEMASRCRVLVLDDHEESIRILRTRFPEDRILRVSGTGIPLPDATLDFLTALDVLEHIEKDAAAANEFARVLKPGGCAVVTVPASMALWSDWDVALHHYRRYDRRSLVALFDPAKWDLLHVNYTNVAAFPAVWAIRRWRGLRKANEGGHVARTEDAVPPAPVNALLKRLFVGLGKVRGVRFPFGVSLILVARRK
ncbi:putative S-adenosylmethionine-dependent methyltransferase [mine drainage metagenome]|uniref:Putative S-adenosylmethionine-dependent methyltransferase n=1 Tax=mine drainage metagenome TaxID=410659 RepID=A0A1J5S6H0_9ZZZZ